MKNKKPQNSILIKPLIVKYNFKELFLREIKKTKKNKTTIILI